MKTKEKAELKGRVDKIDAERKMFKLQKAFREKWRPHCPKIDETVMARLKEKPLSQDSPFCPLNVHIAVDLEWVSEECKRVAEELQDNVMWMCEGKARAASNPKITYIEPAQALRDMKKEHDGVWEVLKKIQSKTPYIDGTVLNSLGGNMTLIHMPDPKRSDDELTVTHHINQKPTWKHLFVVLDGEVVPLIKFTDPKDE